MSTVIIGGYDSSFSGVATVEYFGPLNITIPPLSVAVYVNAAVYINGTIYSCGGDSSKGVCYTYDLAANSDTWETFTTINGTFYNNPAVAFDHFFWYFNHQIQEVPVNGDNATAYDWDLGSLGCAVGNGSHSVVMQYWNSTVWMNSNPSSPTNWKVILELNPAVFYCGCLWFGNTIFVTGGIDETGYGSNATQMINADTFELTRGAPMPNGIYGHGMGVIDGKPAVIGGHDKLDVLSTIYVYDFSTNSWSLSDRSLPQGLEWFGAVSF